MMLMRSRALASVAALALVFGLALAARPYMKATGLVVRAAGLGGRLETTARAFAGSISVPPETSFGSRYGAVPAQTYEPDAGARRTVLLIPGIHPLGMREARLTSLARELAATGVRVVTFGLPDLAHYTITPQSTDIIEDAALWASSNAAWAPDGRVGIVGVSFAGGLAVVAAGRDAVRDKVAFVVSFGGHGDLPRVMRYLATGESPQAPGIQAVPPHDFGVAVLLYGLADSGIVPHEQATPLREALLTYLNASQLAIVNQADADRDVARARQMAALMAEPARGYMEAIIDRKVAEPGAALVPYLERLAADTPSVSPDRATGLPSAPVFLIHGNEDNIIPSAESVVLGDYLQGKEVRARVLITPLITHAGVNRSAASSAWQLVSFWADVLRQ